MLVVEKHDGLRDIFVTWLESTYETEAAADLEAGLAACDEPPDVVLAATRYPAESALSTVQPLLRQADYRVGLVGCGDPDPLLLLLPVDAYLRKPLFEPALRHQVADLQDRPASGPRRAYLALSARLEAVEAAASPAGLAERPEYQRARERLADLEHQLADAAPTGRSVES